MSPTSHEQIIDKPIIDIDASTIDEDFDYSQWNGGYEYGESEFVPAGPSSLVDVDPETIAEINEAAGDLLDKNPNVRTKFMRLLATAGGVTALSFLLAACSSNATESHSPKPHVTHSAKATPSPSPTPTADSSEIFQTEPIAEAPAIVQQIEAMPMDTTEQVAAFNAIPKEDQLTWLSWATNDSIPEYASEYQAKSHDVNDVYPTTISINNTAQQALTVGNYNTRVARSMPTAADAQKALIASLPDGIDDGAYQAELVKLKLDFLPWIPMSASDDEESYADVASTVTNSPVLETNASGRQYYDIQSSYSFTNDAGTISSGNNIPNTAYYYTYKDFKGVEQSTWLTS